MPSKKNRKEKQELNPQIESDLQNDSGSVLPENYHQDASNTVNYTNLVIRGGGAKGFVLPGAIQGLEETHMLAKIERVAGSSVGAIFSMLIAIGMDANELKEIVLGMDLSQFTTDFSITNLAKGGLYSPDTLKHTLKKLIAKKIAQYVNEIQTNTEDYTDEERQELNTIFSGNDLGVEEVADAFEMEQNPIISSEAEIIERYGNTTFRQLASLKRIVNQVNINKIKDLTVTATIFLEENGQKKGKTLYINANSVPSKENNYTDFANWSIASSVTASANLPILFTEYEENGVNLRDGGIFANTPTYAFEEKDINGNLIANPETLVLVMDNSDEYTTVLHKFNTEEYKNPAENTLAKKAVNILGLNGHLEATHDEAERLHNAYSHNTIILSTLGIDTASKNVSTSKKEDAIKGAYLAFKKWHYNYLPHLHREMETFDDSTLSSNERLSLKNFKRLSEVVAITVDNIQQELSHLKKTLKDIKKSLHEEMSEEEVYSVLDKQLEIKTEIYHLKTLKTALIVENEVVNGFISSKDIRYYDMNHFDEHRRKTMQIIDNAKNEIQGVHRNKVIELINKATKPIAEFFGKLFNNTALKKVGFFKTSTHETLDKSLDAVQTGILDHIKKGPASAA